MVKIEFTPLSLDRKIFPFKKGFKKGLMVIGIVVIVLVIVMSIIVEKARRQALARDNEAGVPEVVVTTDPSPRPGKSYTALLPTATPDRCQSTGCMPLKTVSLTTYWYDRRDYGPPDVNDVHLDQGAYLSSPSSLLKRHNTQYTSKARLPGAAAD